MKYTIFFIHRGFYEQKHNGGITQMPDKMKVISLHPVMKGKFKRGEETDLDAFLGFAFPWKPSAHNLLSLERYYITDAFLWHRQIDYL